MSRYVNGTVFVLLGLACVLGASESVALDRTVQVEAPHVISDRAGKSRMLLDCAPPEEVLGEWVSSAFLRISLPALIPREDIDIRVTSIETSWRGLAPTWQVPWRRPGGDLGDTGGLDVTLDKGRPVSSLKLDVTHLVRAMALGELPRNGLALTGGRGWFDDAEVGFLGSPSKVELEVNYRKLSAIGVQDGGRVLLDRKGRR